MAILGNILIGIILLVLFALVITMLCHLFLRVPYVPTPRRVAEAMVELSELKTGETAYDLGAGDGRILRIAERSISRVLLRGYELVPTVWFFGKIINVFHHSRMDLRCADALAADVTDADVVFLYLFPSLMGKLEERFDRQLHPGARVVSHTFRFPKRKHVDERSIRHFWGTAHIFLYRW